VHKAEELHSTPQAELPGAEAEAVAAAPAAAAAVPAGPTPVAEPGEVAEEVRAATHFEAVPAAARPAVRSLKPQAAMHSEAAGAPEPAAAAIPAPERPAAVSPQHTPAPFRRNTDTQSSMAGRLSRKSGKPS